MAVQEQRNNIFEAAANVDCTSVKFFIEQENVPANSTDSEQQTAAHIAAKNNDLETLKYLLNVDPSLRQLSDDSSNTVVSILIAQDARDVIKCLVEEGLLDISEPNDQRFGNTAIHEAAEKNRLQILRYFVEEKNADVNIRNEFGEPPAFLAAFAMHIRIVKYLLAKGANLTATDDHNDNILFMSAKRDDPILPKFLLNEKKIRLNVNWKNDLNITVVHTAAQLNNINFLKYIVGEKRAEVNIRDNCGRSPLHLAALTSSYDSVQYLFKQGANPQMKDNYGNTALKLATQIGSRNIMKYLDKVMLKRYRRDISGPSVIPSFVLKDEPVEGSITTGSWLPDAFPHFDRFYEFFLIIDYCLRYFAISSHHNVGKKPTPTRNLIESKIDPLAVDAVNNTKHIFT